MTNELKELVENQIEAKKKEIMKNINGKGVIIYAEILSKLS